MNKSGNFHPQDHRGLNENMKMDRIHSREKSREEWVEQAIKSLDEINDAIDNLKYSFAIFTSIIKDKLK